MTFVFDADLTWSVTGTVSGEEKTASGTWERDGEALTLTQTYEDGEKSDEPQTLEGTYADGVIHLRPAGAEGEMIPFDLVLRKAP
jgi:hypothetical protein